MRVVHLVRQFHPSIGGLEDAVLNLALHQRAAGNLHAEVVTLDRLFTQPAERLPAATEVRGIPVRRVAWRGSSRYPFAPAAFAGLRSPDVLHVHAIDFFFDAAALLRRWLRPGALVASTHGGFFHTSAGRAKRAWFQSVTRASAGAYDVIVATSAADAAMFAPLRPPLLTTIENGVDLAKFAGAADGTASGAGRQLISFGRFASHKRLPAVLALLRALRTASGQDWSLVLAGAPGDVAPESLRREATAAGVGDAVRIVIAPDTDQLRQLISECSYYVCASAHEGFGLAAVEAMSAGLIPVLSRIAPFQALLAQAGDGASFGIGFDPENPAAAAADLLALEQNIGQGMAEARARSMAAAQKFGWPGAAAAYRQIYDVAASSRGLPRPANQVATAPRTLTPQQTRT